MAKNGERVWGKGRGVWKKSRLQLCVFSVGAGLVQTQCTAWRPRLWSRCRALDMENVSYERWLTSCAVLTQLVGIIPAGST